MINATINDPTAKNQASNEPTKVGTGSVVANKSAQTPAPTATPSKAPIFNMPTTPPSPVTPTPVEFNKGVVGGNLNKPTAGKPELKNTESMGAPAPTSTPPGSNEKPSKPKKKNRFDVKMIAGVFALLLIVVGAGAGLFLSQQPQDIRQQADDTVPYSGNECTIDYHCAGFGENARCDDGFCVSDSTFHDCTAAEGGKWDGTKCVYPGGSKVLFKLTSNCSESYDPCPNGCNLETNYCYPTEAGETDNPIVVLSDEMIDSGTTLFQEVNEDGTYTGNLVTAAQFNDPNVIVSGFYWHNGKRYVIGVPSTMAAVTQASTNNTELWEELNIGDPSDGSSIDLRPRIICDATNSDTSETLYNIGNCDEDSIVTTDQYGNVITLSGTTIDGVFYLDDGGYNDLVDLGQTWVSQETGCNDGVHDGTTDSPTNTNFAGDCVAWHWTTCLNEGTGVGGYGCDVEPPDNPPGEETPPPTLPPELGCNDACSSQTQCSDMNINWFCDTETSGNCRLIANPVSTTCDPIVIPGEPMCKDVAVLEDGVEINPATAPLSIGTVLQFRCAADDIDGQVTNYEFQITEPDGTIVDGTAINPALASATSLEYQIDQYLEHQVQCRVCTSDGCQEWISIAQ